MKIALFIDVDGVLTDHPINMQIARILGVEDKLQDVEESFL